MRFSSQSLISRGNNCFPSATDGFSRFLAEWRTCQAYGNQVPCPPPQTRKPGSKPRSATSRRLVARRYSTSRCTRSSDRRARPSYRNNVTAAVRLPSPAKPSKRSPTNRKGNQRPRERDTSCGQATSASVGNARGRRQAQIRQRAAGSV